MYNYNLIDGQMKKISVIIPTYNRDEPLRKTLKSLFAQNYPDFEIIVIDQSDKEFPKKEEFLRRWATKIRYFKLEEKSIPKAINLGVEKARGEIVFLTDDDILADKNLLKEHIARYNNAQVSGVQGRVVTPGQKEEPNFLGVGRISPWGTVAGGFSSKIPQEVKNVIGCNVSFRKEIFKKVGGVEENFVGNALRWETDLALRVIRAGGKIVFEPKAEIIHLRAKSGGCRMDNRRQWFFDFFRNEAYFCCRWIAWYWWPIFWLARWRWFLRCMFGRGRSWQTIITPFLGIWEGVRIKKIAKTGRIGIDGGCLGVEDKRLKVGVYQVAFNLIKEWGRMRELEGKEILLYSFLPIEKEVMKEFGPRVKNIVVRPKRGWNWIWLPWRLRQDKPEVFWGISQSLPQFLPCPGVVLVHDLAFEHYPEYYPHSYNQLRRITFSAVKRAKKIVAVSWATKNDLVNFYRVPSQKIKVVWEGVDSFFKPGKKGFFRKDYFLFVGALKPIKNIPKILEAYHLFLQKTGKNIPFVFAGGDRWLDEKIKPTVEKLGLEKKVKFLGYVSQEKLLKLYQGALAFVSPALYEGFGLTLLEAMACGCPVIAGNTGAQPEVVGKAGILADPSDVAGLAKAMEEIANNTTLRRKLAFAGRKRAQQFSWEKFAREIIGLIG